MRPRQRFVYAICEIETGKVVYVGETGNIVQRLRTHRSGCDQSTGVWFKDVPGREFGMIILDIVKESEAALAEKRWISFYEKRGPLLNRRGAAKEDAYLARTDSLRRAARATGRSMYALAKAVGCRSQKLVRAHRGLISMPMKLATKVQTATISNAFPEGFVASRDNWPKLVDVDKVAST